VTSNVSNDDEKIDPSKPKEIKNPLTGEINKSNITHSSLDKKDITNISNKPSIN